MKYARFILSSLAVLCLFSAGFSQGYHVRLGTIGNSITHGIALPSPSTQAFPVLLDEMLEGVYGDTCLVSNFGLTTTTMLKSGDVSYWDTRHLKEYLTIAPEICFIMLGTNDTKPQNWDEYGDEFIGDYLAMIDTIKARNPSTRFILAYPPPAFEIKWGIRDSIVVNGVIPAIDSIAKLVDVEIMDFYYPLLDSAHLFPDMIHPGIEGNVLMAEMLLTRIVESDLIHRADTGRTFITSFEYDKDLFPVGESAELSWTTINADSVFINGEPVEIEGSLQVTPAETSTFTLLASGQVSSDTSIITLEVYTQDLTRMNISPFRRVRDVGDTIPFRAFHYDQFDRPISGTFEDVSWSIDGSGSLYEETDSSVYFICEKPDTSYLKVSFGDISSTATIIIRPLPTGMQEEALSGDMKIFPNPGHGLISIQLSSEDGPSEVCVYDLKGILQLRRKLAPAVAQEVFSLNISNLASGNYLLKIQCTHGSYTRQLMVD